MATEVLTSYTITGAHLSNTATTATATNLLGNELSYDLFDFGAGYFPSGGSAYSESTFVLTANSGSSFLGISFSDTANTYPNTVNSSGLQINTTGGLNAVMASSIQASVIATSTPPFSIVIGNTYYTRIGYLSSLGQFGGSIVQFFSNAARTTLVGSVVYKRASAPAYRYFIALQSLNGGAVGNVSATNANITLYRPIDETNLVSYTTIGTTVSRVANCATAAGLGTNETTYLHSGAIYATGYFNGDISTIATLANIAFTGANTSLAINILSFVNLLEHGNTASTRQTVILTWVSATLFNLKIESYIGGTLTSAATPSLSINSPYWLLFTRVGNLLTLNVYNDVNFASLNCTVTLTLASAPAFQYVLPIQSRNLVANNGTVSFTLGGVRINTSVSSMSIGGSLAGGISLLNIGRAVNASGGSLAGGTSQINKGRPITSSGGALLGGNSKINISRIFVSSGGVIVGGSSTILAAGSHAAFITASGGVRVGGSSVVVKHIGKISTSGVIVGGSSSTIAANSPNIQEILYELYDSVGVAITGATASCKLRSGSTIYDWSDNTFKTSGWVSSALVMTQVDAINLPGLYKVNLDIANLPNGKYQVFIGYAAAQNQHGSIEFTVVSGKLIDTYTSGAVGNNAVAPDNATIATINTKLGIPTVSVSADIATRLATVNYTAPLNSVAPTAAENAAAVLAAAVVTPIEANVKKMNSANVLGTGQVNDKWRG